MQPVVVKQVDERVLEVRSGSAVTLVDGSGRSDGTFRSAELLLGALGSCVVGTMLSRARDLGCDISDVRIELRHTVSGTSPERIVRIRAVLTYDGAVSPEQERELVHAASSCKIHTTLHHGVETSLEVNRVPRES